MKETIVHFICKTCRHDMKYHFDSDNLLDKCWAMDCNCEEPFGIKIIQDYNKINWNKLPIGEN
jgi:hypothetical protein